MDRQKIRAHQQAILDAFDAGEHSAAALGRAHGYTTQGICLLLRRYGRQTRTPVEANIIKNAERRAAKTMVDGDLYGTLSHEASQ